MKYFIGSLLFLNILFGLALTAVNFYGLFADLRPNVFFADDLRFKDDDEILPYKKVLERIQKRENEDLDSFLARVNQTISEGLAHIEWDTVDKDFYHQRVPIWENYFLYFMGEISGIPEFERYHFTDYKRSLERGIVICGDASIILSEILNKHQIPNKIISFPGHVITTVSVSLDKEHVYDPDFGVFIPHSITEINNNPSMVKQYYSDKGYQKNEILALQRAYQLDYQVWDGVKHFLTKKYYFERLTYFLKWPFPIFLVIISLYIYLRHKNKFTDKS
jgi:hypothetical protein